MAKEVAGLIKLQIKGGDSTPELKTKQERFFL